MADLEDRMHDLGEFIRDQRRRGQLSLRKLSEMAGISNPYLSQIERGLRKPSAEILQRIARALEISAESLYLRAGILDDTTERLDASVAIREDPHLTESHKAELLHLYRTFRDEAAGARRRPGTASPESHAG
jgi:transcriptional regulator with XRE-family HTH domain